MKRCPDHPLLRPAQDVWTGRLYCSEDARTDIVPDVFDVILDARHAYMLTRRDNQRPTDIRLGSARYMEMVRLAELEYGTNMVTAYNLFGMRLHEDHTLQPDAVLVGRYIGETWDLEPRRDPM